MLLHRYYCHKNGHQNDHQNHYQNKDRDLHDRLQPMLQNNASTTTAQSPQPGEMPC